MTSRPDTASGHYAAPDSGVFGLALRTGLLSLITLGIYRFWAKTRLRKYFWSNTRIGNDGFEYTGTGLEKFLGFLVAVVVLAIYLAAVQLILFQFGLFFVFNPQTEAEVLMQLAVVYASLFALAPLLLFAQYRSRRYKLARTRFRGIRFGMEKAAGGYVLRGIGYLLATILSLGLLWPLMTYKLEAWMTNRSWYGDTKFTQGGRWAAMYGPYKHVLIGVVVMIAGIVAGAMTQSSTLIGVSVFVGYLWLFFGFLNYSVQGFGYLTRTKRLGADITFGANPRTGTVLGRVVLGYLLIGILAAAVFFIGAAVFGGVFYAAMGGSLESGELQSQGSLAVAGILLAVAYLVFLAFVGAMVLAFITEPVIKHYVSTITVQNVAALDVIRQRVTDKGADAEGFADALDWGGAI
jgi:uncharacterized membrane protein YjgN (DUF898 family)